MGFLSPWFLLGALALGIPLWLHLLRQYKRNPQPFSSLMFFERRIQSSVKHRRLRYLALLALRMALLLLLVLAFANPFVNRTSVAANRRTLTVVAVDRSFSMRYGHHLQEAKDRAGALLNTFPAQTLTQLIAVDSHVEHLTPPGQPQSLRAALDTLQPSDLASSFGDFTRSLRGLVQTTGMRLDVHFISDMQATSMPADFHDLQLGPDISLHLHRVGERDQPNWAIENVVVPASVDSPEQARVVASVTGWQTPPATGSVSLVLDGKTVATKSVSLAQNGRASVEFDHFQVPYGWHRGEVRLQPADALPQDNTFPFAVEHQDPRKVLLLYASNRFSNAAFYYKAALESGSGSAFILQTMDTSAVRNYDFTPFAFVVLSDVGQLDSSLADALCSYVEKGGAVLVTLGPRTAVAGTIPLSKEQLSQNRVRQTVGYLDRANSAVASTQIANVQFSETALFSPKPDARVLARFADGSPMLVEERAGEGRKLLFASTFDNSTNDFALHSSFVPFVVQTARYLAGMEENPSSVVSGTPVTLRHRTNTGAADVVGPDGRHELPLEEAAKTLSFDLVQSGFYEISRADGRKFLTAVHADPRESDLRRIPDETLDLWSHTGDTSRRAENTGQRTETRPSSYWRYFLVLALLVALVESLFANRYLAGKNLKEG